MTWGLRNLDKEHSKSKGPEADTSGVDSGSGGEATVAEGQRGLRDAI